MQMTVPFRAYNGLHATRELVFGEVSRIRHRLALSYRLTPFTFPAKSIFGLKSPFRNVPHVLFIFPYQHIEQPYLSVQEM